MQRAVQIGLSLILLFGSIVGVAAQPQMTITPGDCQDGVLPSRALSRFCVPTSGWNRDLVVWAHGYVDFTQPKAFYHLVLPDGTDMSQLVQKLGFAFATTSYRQNGLVIREGIDDIRQLVAAFRTRYGTPRYTYLLGASEGGAITVLSIEKSPQLFSGGLAGCGPIGGFGKQLTYFADFHVLFDYFFPDILPRWTQSNITIPSKVISNWDKTYVPAITAAVKKYPDAAKKLITTSHAPIDPADPASVITTTVNLMWYSTFATNDSIAKLGGNPYDNQRRWYAGSGEDIKLNRQVARFHADAVALANLKPYNTTGKLTLPLVTLHTTRDEIIPYWHEGLYRDKLQASKLGRLTTIPVLRYGHCNFHKAELLTSFGLLVLQVTGKKMDAISQEAASGQSRSVPSLVQ